MHGGLVIVEGLKGLGKGEFHVSLRQRAYRVERSAAASHPALRLGVPKNADSGKNNERV